MFKPAFQKGARIWKNKLFQNGTAIFKLILLYLNNILKKHLGAK